MNVLIYENAMIFILAMTGMAFCIRLIWGDHRD